MPIYILLSRLSQQGVATLKSNPDRLREVNRDVEELGAKVLHQWATLGEFDFVNVVEAPDTATIARVSVALGARGLDEDPDAARADDRRLRRDAELVRHCGDAPHGHAPRLPGREELVRVDVDAPADEVRLRIVGGAAVDGGVLLRGRLLAHAAGVLFRAALGLFGRRAFHVTARHVPRVL